MDLFAACRRFSDERDLLPPGSSVLVALSGGADSTFLLHFLADLRPARDLALAALYVDHAVRPAPEIAAEIALARSHCERLDLPFAVERIPIGTGSDEASLRVARYSLLEAAADQAGSDRIALGHTESDQAETLLLRLFRGAGLHGLAGIPARRGRVVRPLMALPGATIRAWLAGRGIAWSDDSTNRSLRPDRNRLRHLVLPAIEAAFPGAVRRVADFAARAGLTDDAFERAVDELFARHGAPGPCGPSVPAAVVGTLHPALRARIFIRLYAAAAGTRLGLSARHVAAMERAALAPTEKSAVSLPGGLRFERDGGRLQVHAADATPPEAFAIPVEPPAAVELPRFGALEFEVADATSAPLSDGYFLFDADRLAFPLLVRGFRPGDRIRPFGLDGTKKVKKVLQERRIPRALRAHVPILCDADGTVLLVAGEVRSDAAPVGPGTLRALAVRVVRRHGAGSPREVAGEPKGD